MKCSKCGKENRQEAKYCRFCGEVIAQEPSLEGLIGKDSILPVLESLDARLKVASGRANSGARFGMDCLVLGDSGTGKNFIARLIAGKMLSSGVIKTPPKVVDAAEWAEFAGNFDENIGQLRDGVLIITNAQKLVPTTRATDVILLDKLFMRMRTTEGAPVLILCGMLNEMSDFLEHNPDVHRLFEFDFKLESFGVQELTQLTKSLLEDKFGLKADDDLPARLKAHFTWYMRQPDLGHNNGHLAERVAEDLSVRAALRGSKTVSACDVDPKECFIPKSEEDILAELDSYIGLQSVKDQIRAIVKSVKDKKEKGVAANKLITDHFIFTGNPGTGKTTFARKLGEVLSSIGALPTGQFEEIEAKSLLGQWLGHTEENVRKAVAKAMGGVLFIDEAYALSQSTVGVSGGSFGMDAINTLLPILENRRGEFVCIMAGYTKEMGEFVRTNPGIPSRCNVTIVFPDYNARELEQLFRMFMKRNDYKTVFTLDPEADEMLSKVCEKMYLKRTDTFGNAREVRNLFDNAVKNASLRGEKNGVLTYADIAGEDAVKGVSVEQVMKELDGFVGMGAVKDAIKRIAKEIAVQQRLIELGEAGEGLTKFNFILTGNPGTGKSTVARTFGKIFKALGVTSTDRVTEKTPKDIISTFKGESAKQMNAAVNEAMGGVLFLDEAYDIEPMDQAGQSTSNEGHDAIQALLTRMENDAGKFVVICAGYPKEMETFMNSNPGLKRRFSHFIHIDDYSAEELLEIYERAAKAKRYNFTLADDAARIRALNMFQNMVAMKDGKFGNAGEAIKKVAETKTNINNRIADIPSEQWTPEVLASARLAYADDIPYEEPEKVSVEKCLEELNQLIGLEGVKTSLTKLAHTINNEIESARLENRRPEIPLGHYLFLGNPGTGKTTVARLMGKILYSMGALPSPKVIEVGVADLKGRYLGDSEAVTKHIIDTAMGGILFIDEAYQIAGNDQYSQSIMNVLLTRLENDRGKFVCIAAGYTYEMQAFIHNNSGIPSRFPERNWITFEDYTPDELYQIFMIYAKRDGYTLDPMAQNAVKAKLTLAYNNRDRMFGNAREARNLFDGVKENLAARLAEEGGVRTPEERKTITMEDVL